MKTKLLTIKQYADLKGITQQAIYKSINNKKLKCKVVKGQKYIELADAEIIDNNKKLSNENKQEQQQNIDAELVELLKQQLAEKDKQIENLTITNNNLTTMLAVKEQQVLQLTYKPTFKEKVTNFFNKNKNDAN